MGNKALKRAQAKNIARRLAAGEIDESEARILRSRRGIKNVNAAQKAQNQQAKDISAIGDLLAGSGAGVRAEEPEKVRVEDMELNQYDAAVGDRYSQISTGLTLEENLLINAVGRAVSHPLAVGDEELLVGNVLRGHRQIEIESEQEEINVENAKRR